MTADQPLFYLNFTAKAAADIQSSLSVNSEVTPAAAFFDLNTVARITLKARSRIDVANAEDFELFQNTPNPFNDLTSVAFRLPESGKVHLKIFDLTGRQVYTVNNHFEKGLNNIQLRKSEIGLSGVYYYQLESGKYNATKKMIIIE